MAIVNLHPFLRPNLDVLFIALNPPVQSNINGHYFSGSGSRFFRLLYLSGLITEEVPKSHADELVFGSTCVNYRRSEFGIIDLVENRVETNSSQVKPSHQHVTRLLARIREHEPRFVCIIHSKVRDAVNKHAGLTRALTYGLCGPLLHDIPCQFVLNYFPNGNAVPDEPKLKIFRELKNAL